MRIKIVEVLKFIVAVAIGFTLRVMFENSHDIITQYKPCNIKKESIIDTNLENLHEQLRQPHEPISIQDVIEYRYFDTSVVFDTHLGHVKTHMKPYHRSDIRDIIKQVESLMNAGVNDRLRYNIKRLVNGFERIDPIRGKEYVIDIEVTRETAPKLEHNATILRCSIVKPFSYARLVSLINVSPEASTKINMLYILNEKNIDFIRYILKHHEEHIVSRFPVNVTMFICSESPISVKIQYDVALFSIKYKSVSSYKLNLVVNETCQFKAAETTNDAVRSISGQNSRIVILDSNVNVTHQFLQRCSSVLSDKPNNAYVPIPFASYLHQSKHSVDDLSEDSGVWDHDNFEVLCIHKQLFTDLNGLNKNEYRVDAYKSFINKLILQNKEIFRSTDPSVRVFYHNIDCKEQESLKYSNHTHCESRQRKTFMPQSDVLSAIKLH